MVVYYSPKQGGDTRLLSPAALIGILGLLPTGKSPRIGLPTAGGKQSHPSALNAESLSNHLQSAFLNVRPFQTFFVGSYADGYVK